MTQQQYPKICYTEQDKERRVFEGTSEGDERTPFERDRSRIIHSAAFRRLQGKTQVFTTGEGDFFRTRLTHSLEVAQIGKGLALRLGADPDLVEAVSLVHDIGHPPFGHAGENELNELMKNFGGFEANAQNLRILTQLERKNSEYDGLNLTRAVIDGQLKYKEPYAENREKFVYEKDLKMVEWASESAQAAVSRLDEKPQSFECKIMDWADEVAYAVHDLEDSIHAGYIDSSAFLESNRRTNAAIERCAGKFQLTHPEITDIFRGFKCEMQQIDPYLFKDSLTASDKEKKSKRKELTSFLIHRYIAGVRREERGAVSNHPESYRYCFSMEVQTEHKVEVSFINIIIRKFVFESPQVRRLEANGRHIVRSLFDKFTQGDNAEYLLPDDWTEYFEPNSSNTEKARVVSDYISGMTDNYARKTYAQLFLPNQGSIYEIL